MNLMTPQEMEKIIDAAGLYHTEAAKLFDNVTRQTLAGWLKGVPPKNHSIYERAQKTCLLLRLAIEKGLLPLPQGTTPKTRMPLIMGIIRSLMRPGN